MTNVESQCSTSQMRIYEEGIALDGTRMRMPLWEVEFTKSQRTHIEEKPYEFKNF